MGSLKANPIIRFFSSVKLTLVLLLALAFACATATFIESAQGTTAAQVLVYRARWFELLLVILVVNLIVMFIARLPVRRTQIGFVITHFSFIVILVGAGITRHFGFEGTMSIREGSSTNFLYSNRQYVQLSYNGATASFPISLYKAGKTSIHHKLTAGGQSFEVSLLEYWPHEEQHLVEGPGGQPALRYATQPGAAADILREGESQNLQGVTVHFLGSGEEFPATSATSRYGDLVIRIGGEEKRLAVPLESSAETSLGGYRFRIVEFDPDFRVGKPPSPTDEMNNPAIRVEIDGPGGGSWKQLLFAYHPEFAMGHAGQEPIPDEIKMTYQVAGNLYLRVSDDGRLMGQADVPLEALPMTGGGAGGAGAAGQGTIVAGESFLVQTGVFLRSGRFSFVPTEFWKSAVMRAGLSRDPRQPPASRIAVRDAAGDRAEAVVVHQGEETSLQVGQTWVGLAVGPVKIPLPYRLQLDDFVLKTYPGSDNPASFESDVRLYDEQRGVDGRAYRIYMNHPLTYRGYKHFQSSYDKDRKGTILSVNHDPGKWPTYCGYVLITIGFLITLTRGWVWNRHPEP